MQDGRARPKTTLAMCGLAQAVGGGFAWSVVPMLTPAIAKDLGLSPTLQGLIWGAAPLGIALFAPVGGALVDRFGVRRTVPLALLLGAAACAARAIAHGPLALLAAMFVFGAHVGLCAPAIPKALAMHVPVQKLGRANGAALLCYTLSTAVTVLVAATLLAPALGGWRPTMVVAGAAMVVTAVLFFGLVRDRGALSRHAGIEDALRMARDPAVRRLAAMQLLLFGGYLAMLGLLPGALIGAGIAPAKVGMAIAGWLGVAAIANLAGPWASDRLRLRRPFLVGGAVVAGLALLAMAALPAAQGLPLLAVAAVGGGCFAPLLLSMPLELPSVGPARAGAALGVLLLMGQVGGFALPVAVGVAAQHGGLPLALAVLGVVHLAIVIPAKSLPEPLRGDATLPALEPSVA